MGLDSHRERSSDRVSDRAAIAGAHHMPRTLAIIPAFNEALSLPDVLADLTVNAPSIDVLVVDDGSTDATATVARRHGAYVAVLPFNLGIGAALRTGFRFAATHDYDRAFQFDADGQHSSLEIHKLLARLDAGADLVIGSRFSTANDKSYAVGLARGTAMGLLRLLIQLLLARTFTDTSSGFRGFSRPMISYFASNYPREYMDSVEALVAASYRGFRVEEVSVRMHERAAGTPSNRRFKLAYNYLRLLSMLLLTMSFRGRRSMEARE